LIANRISCEYEGSTERISSLSPANFTPVSRNRVKEFHVWLFSWEIDR
jgi:hypothetical protein